MRIVHVQLPCSPPSIILCPVCRWQDLPSVHIRFQSQLFTLKPPAASCGWPYPLQAAFSEWMPESRALCLERGGWEAAHGGQPVEDLQGKQKVVANRLGC